MKNRRRLLIFIITFSLLIGWDRISKEIAKRELTGKGSLTYFHDTFELVYVENTGAFLSLGSNWPAMVSYLVFVAIPLIFLTGFGTYVLIKRNELEPLVFYCYVFILAGGIGNIIDRIFYHMRVSDFMNFGIGNLRTGILNFADMYITFGVLILVFFQGLIQKKKKEITAPETPDPGNSQPS